MAAGAEPFLETEIADPRKPETFTWKTKYDALDRPIWLKMPDKSEVVPTYNEANLLDKVKVRLRGKKDRENKPIFTLFVKDIEYDAKGQRTSILYDSGVKTTYTYDSDTFRLTHLLTRLMKISQIA